MHNTKKNYPTAHALATAAILTELRRARGITQGGLARSIGVSQALISRMERRGNFPGATVFLAILRELNISSVELDDLVESSVQVVSKSIDRLPKEVRAGWGKQEPLSPLRFRGLHGLVQFAVSGAMDSRS